MLLSLYGVYCGKIKPMFHINSTCTECITERHIQHKKNGHFQKNVHFCVYRFYNGPCFIAHSTIVYVCKVCHASRTAKIIKQSRPCSFHNRETRAKNKPPSGRGKYEKQKDWHPEDTQRKDPQIWSVQTTEIVPENIK